MHYYSYLVANMYYNRKDEEADIYKIHDTFHSRVAHPKFILEMTSFRCIFQICLLR